MDPVKLEKLRAMNKYRRTQFLQVIFQYCLTILVLILCLSKSTWFISLCSFLKLFFLFTLPHLGAYVMNPKCLFVLCNTIIVILVGEFKLVGSPSSSPSSEIYDEYVLRLRSQSRSPLREEKQGGGKRFESSVSLASLERIQEVVEEEEEDEVGVLEEEKEDEEEEREQEEKKEEEEELVRGGEEEEGDEEDVNGEGDEGLPTDELNKRVEDFIAKINRQRRMEEETMLCSG